MRVLRFSGKFSNKARCLARGEQCSAQDLEVGRPRFTWRNTVHYTFPVYRVREAHNAVKDCEGGVSRFLPGRRRYSFIAQVRSGSDAAATAVRNEIISQIMDTSGLWETRKNLRSHSLRHSKVPLRFTLQNPVHITFAPTIKSLPCETCSFEGLRQLERARSH